MVDRKIPRRECCDRPDRLFDGKLRQDSTGQLGDTRTCELGHYNLNDIMGGVTPDDPKPVDDRTFKLIGYGFLTVIGWTLVFTTYGHPLEGFLLGLAAFIFIWKTGLIDVITVWWP